MTVTCGLAGAQIQAVRVARHTERLDEVAAFYRDGLGLVEVGGFREHSGYDGVFLALPGTEAHLELTSGGELGAPDPHPESLLVLYLGDAAAVEAILERVGDPVAPSNPYLAEHGVTVVDPDGFRVVLVPERWAVDGGATAIRVRAYDGPRERLRWLFELAEDSPRELDSYLNAGRVLVALDGEQVVGHVQLTESEIRSLAVAAAHRGRGVGRALVTSAAAVARDEGRSILSVATAAADVGNLRFYQRLGFRLLAVERDAFTAAAGYPPGLSIDGIELRDRVWLELALTVG